MLVFSHDLHLTTIIKGDGSKVVTQEIEDDKEFKLLELEDDSKVNKPKMTTITHPSQEPNEVCHFSAPTTTIFI